MDPLQVGATWLHLLATVALLGYYAMLAFVVLPAIRPILPAAELAASVASFERRATPILGGSLVVFLATGVFLMVTNDRYEGVGEVTGSTWATLFLVKHVVIAIMLGLGVYIDALVIRGFALPGAADARAQRRLALTTAVMTGLGALVLLLTAAGQLS